MAIIKNKGAAAMESADKKGGNSKVQFLRLKGGQSVQVAFIVDRSIPEDVVYASAEYLNHGDFEAGVRSHPCIKDEDTECYSCEVGVPRNVRFAIAFAVLEELTLPAGKGKTVKLQPGSQVILDVSKKQYNAIKGAVKDYIEEEAIFGMPFKLTKTGDGTDSSFAIAPMIGKAANALAEIVAAVQATEIDENFFEEGLRPKTNEQLREYLKGYVKASGSDDESEEESESESAEAASDEPPFDADPAQQF